MGLFGLFKSNPVKDIHDGTRGCLLREHGISTDELSKNIRCVEKRGEKNGCRIDYLRIFSLRDVKEANVTVTGWETFDQHPELLMFEGFIAANTAHLERKAGK